ncbi:unnamed protein product [Protopolystoma xenopodis]|uniref:Uncharacterized protein n=1 Tax=Protopolystoma xenopodis TaxID=117903 RepID=A0A3S4ZWY2_9PLAT|nr:unnamed protein product [Protopolystoma xenopodis]
MTGAAFKEAEWAIFKCIPVIKELVLLTCTATKTEDSRQTHSLRQEAFERNNEEKEVASVNVKNLEASYENTAVVSIVGEQLEPGSNPEHILNSQFVNEADSQEEGLAYISNLMRPGFGFYPPLDRMHISVLILAAKYVKIAHRIPYSTDSLLYIILCCIFARPLRNSVNL